MSRKSHFCSAETKGVPKTVSQARVSFLPCVAFAKWKFWHVSILNYLRTSKFLGPHLMFTNFSRQKKQLFWWAVLKRCESRLDISSDVPESAGGPCQGMLEGLPVSAGHGLPFSSPGCLPFPLPHIQHDQLSLSAASFIHLRILLAKSSFLH